MTMINYSGERSEVSNSMNRYFQRNYEHTVLTNPGCSLWLWDRDCDSVTLLKRESLALGDFALKILAAHAHKL